MKSRLKQLAVAGVAAAMSIAGMAGSSQAEDTIKLGISAPTSGAAAAWGIGYDWVAQRAVEHINENGGVKVGDKTYKFEVTTYDNKYNAAEGAKAAQTMINRDGVNFVVGSIGTAPVQALQSLTERKKLLLFTSAWGRSLKGSNHPLTYTNINTPAEVLVQLYGYVAENNPDAKTVALLNPNDATGQNVERDAKAAWASVGVEVVASDWFERGVTEFQPIATKLRQVNPDIIDVSSGPPAVAGQLFKELAVQGWEGEKVVAAGTGADALVKTGGDAAEGTYMGLAADFSGSEASDIQRELNGKAKKELGEPLNVIHIGTWDSITALKAAMESAGSIEPEAVAAELPKIVFDSSYGKAAFGSEDVYGVPQQLLVPTIVTQIQDGKVVEVKRVVPAELAKRIGGN